MVINPSWFQVDLWLVMVAAVCVAGFIVITIIWGRRAHWRQISAGREELIGKTAEVKVALEPKGVVFIQDERWAAISETGRVEPGEEVIVSRVDGLKLYVTKKQ